MKIYVGGAVEALRKKERQDDEFITKIAGKTSLSLSPKLLES